MILSVLELRILELARLVRQVRQEISTSSRPHCRSSAFLTRIPQGENAQEAPEDPSEFFAKAFGGEAFRDYVRISASMLSGIF